MISTLSVFKIDLSTKKIDDTCILYTSFNCYFSNDIPYCSIHIESSPS